MPRTRRAQQSTDPGRAASAASSSHSRPASVVAPSDLFCTGHTRYDANGNRTTKTDASGTTTYTWDARDRLVQAVVQTATQTTTVTFAYDALGRRVRRTVVETTGGSTTTRTIDYVYDTEDVILAVETTDAGGTPTTVTTRYVHGPGIDEPLLVEQGGQGYAAHADALGSLTGLSDGSQTLAEASTYTSFGQLSRSGTAAGNPYAYTGREWEPELSLSYYRARYYDPEAGRFLSRDPIGFAGGDTNLYAYVMNDAVNHSDPSGLTWRTNTRFLWDFLTGSGDRERVYSSDDIQTLEMRKSLAAQKMRDVFRKAGCRDITNFAYGTYEAARDTLLNPHTADWSSTSAQVGGFARGSVINNGDGTVTFTIPNVAGTKSFFYHAVPERKGTSGLMRSIRQQFQWTERLEDCGC